MKEKKRGKPVSFAAVCCMSHNMGPAVPVVFTVETSFVYTG